MKALVIGSSGLVGEALTRVMQQRGIDVVPTYFSRRPSEDALMLDVTDADAVKRCIDATSPSAVFLCVEAPEAARDHADEARRIHVHGTENVVSALRDRECTLVYYSTDEIFDGRAGPYGEDDLPEPAGPYGRLKLEAESLCAHARCLIVRTSEVFGWNRSSRNLAMTVWRELQARSSLYVSEHRWATPTLADYLAEASLRLVEADETGVFNVAGADAISRGSFAKALARTMGLDADLVEEKDGDAFRGGLRTEKLSAALGTEPHSLSESLKRLRRHWRADTYVSPGAKTATGAGVTLKDEILSKVREYHEAAHAPAAFVPFKTRINYAGRVFGADEMINLVDSALDFWLTLGPYGDLFERRLKDFFGAKDAVIVTSGSAANLAAIMTLLSRQLERPLEPDDEIITPAVTFPTTLAPIVHSGLVPVFVDCEVGTYNVNPDLLEPAISEKTRGIMIPHTLANPCDMDVIGDLAKRYDLFLVEDTCDALGSTFRDRLVGTFGDLATLSFFPAHHITVGEGGAVIVNTPRMGRIVRSVRDWGRDCWCAPGESNTCGKRFGWQSGDLPHGYDHKFTFSNIGYNLKPTEMQAAIGVAQMDRLPDFVRRRKENFTILYEGLAKYDDYLVLPTIDPRSDPAWFGFPITVKGDLPRDRLVQWLEDAKIETRELFGGNILRQPGYRHIRRRISGTLDESDRIMKDSFFIGVYPGLTEEMLAFMLSRFEAFFATKSWA